MRRKPTVEASAGANAAESVERRAGAKGNTHQQSTYWAQNQARVSQALERTRQDGPSYTRGRSRVRESRTHGSGRGARGETHVPTATPSRVHHAPRRRGGVAARGAGAAVGDASNRDVALGDTRNCRRRIARLSQRPSRRRLR